MLLNVQKTDNYFDLSNFLTSKSTKLKEIITFTKVDFFDKKVSFATVCAHVRLGEPRLAVKLIYIYSTLTLTCKYASKQLYYLSKRGQIKDGSLVPALVHFGLDGLGNPWRVGPLGILLAQQTFIRT